MLSYLLSRAPTYQFAQLENNRVCDRIIDLIPGSSAANESAIPKDLQVLRDVGLIRFQANDDVAYGLLAWFQQLQDTQA